MSLKQLPPRTFALLLVIVVTVLAGVEILAGESRDEDRLGEFREGPPRFTVMLVVEEVGISGTFTEVSGLSSENEVVEFRDGSDPNIVRKFPGPLKYGNITLKRGVTNDLSLWEWRRAVETGNVVEARAAGRIVLLDRGNPVASWRFVNGWPSKIAGPELKGDGHDVALEELVIAHEGVRRAD